MKEYIVYRDRQTKEITQFHPRREITQTQIDAYNEAQAGDTYVRAQTAEIVQVEENSFTEYLIESKEQSLSDYLQDLRDLKDSIDDIRDSIEYRFDDLERRVKKAEGGDKR